MSRGARVVVLCEDQQSKVFIEEALLARGYDRRAIRSVVAPSGRGAGERFVRSHYPEWRAFLRSRPATKGLAVHIDADPTHTVAERHAELAGALKASGQDPRDETEPIAELVPKRNIETWIHALDTSLGTSVLDESDAYPKLAYPSACAAAARAFADHARLSTTPSTAEAVPSLLDGLQEFRRIP